MSEPYSEREIADKRTVHEAAYHSEEYGTLCPDCRWLATVDQQSALVARLRSALEEIELAARGLGTLPDLHPTAAQGLRDIEATVKWATPTAPPARGEQG
jgi:hypothetical protein